MAAERYVLLGLAPARAEWFRAVAHWATGASIPAEFVKCLSPEQLRAQLSSGRAFSAVLVDAAAADRDLLDAAERAAVPVMVVGSVDADLAVAAALPRRFGPDHLLDALAAHARPVDPTDTAALDPAMAAPPEPLGAGRVLAVCGPGGTGASTVAIALAQGLPGRVLLADLKLNAEQAMLHDSRDLIPGVQDLVEAHRARRPVLDEVRRLTYRVDERGYDLLLGLRRARLWPALRRRAVEAAFDSLQAGWDTVVCDIDADVEGEAEGGSADVEDRNVLARTAVGRAAALVVVGLPGMKGLHSMLRVVADVPADVVVPVFNRAPRSPRARAELAAGLRELSRRSLAPPVFLPDRRVDDLFRHGGRLPPVLTGPLVAALVDAPARPVEAPEPVRIAPGSLGVWAEG